MNLNELVINRGRGRGRRGNKNKYYTVTNMGPPLAAPPKKKQLNSSSDVYWGKSHTSAENTFSTPKSAGSSKISSEDDRIIVALTEGRGEARCEVGIAAINVSNSQLILCQISDTQSYINTLTKINYFNPQEILVPITFIKTFPENRLLDKVKERFPRIKFTGCPRSTFNKGNGIDVLNQLCVPSLNAILLVLEHRYYALAAASALITYIQDNLFVYYAAGSVKIDYQESEGYAIIDVSTADSLELVCSARPAQGNKYSSLFGILNRCMTKIGSRTLRSYILQPPYKVQYIEDRLDAVAELIKNPQMLLSIQALLQKVPNIDFILSIATLIPDDPQRCTYRQLNYVLLLNTVIELIMPLKEELLRSKLAFFVSLADTLGSEDFSMIKDLIRTTVHENASLAKGEASTMQRCLAIKTGVNGLLDLVRKTYFERVDDLKQYVKMLADKYNLPLTLGNNKAKGFHIVLNLTKQQKRYMKKSDIPEEFIEVYRLVGSFTMKTPEVVNYNTRLDDIMTDILRISNVMVHYILDEIKKYIPLFYKLCEGIAHLDVLQSLAECSVGNGYVRPKFGDFTKVSFARHPLLDFVLPTKPIPNPISCSSDYNVHIITGPNGSGKSIFIRQVVLLQVMAQVGCYVPARSAIFRPADRMYARIYLEGNMEHGASSFVLEMKEIMYIMATMTDNSLIIIDELCRSTSVEEGTALAIAIVEKLEQSSAFIYITTHFARLTKLYDMYLNVKLWQLETLSSGDDPKTFKLDFRYSLISGVTTVKRYGVYIVRNIWADRILAHVDELLAKISKKPKNLNIVPIDATIRLKYKLEAEFRKLKSLQKLTLSEVHKLLNEYQIELEKLGCVANVSPIMVNFADNKMLQMPAITHSVFGSMLNDSYIEQSPQDIQEERYMAQNVQDFSDESYKQGYMQKVPSYVQQNSQTIPNKSYMVQNYQNILDESYVEQNLQAIWDESYVQSNLQVIPDERGMQQNIQDTPNESYMQRNLQTFPNDNYAQRSLQDIRGASYIIQDLQNIPDKTYAQQNLQAILDKSCDGKVKEIQDENYMEQDLRETCERMQQNFTPNASQSSQLSAQRRAERMHQMFSPEKFFCNRDTNYINQSLPDLDFYGNYDIRSSQVCLSNYSVSEDEIRGTKDLFDSNLLESNERYREISQFIEENSGNIHKLVPRVNLSYEEVASVDISLRGRQAMFPVLQDVKSPAQSVNSKQSSSLEGMTSFQFSFPLQSNAGKTSTPLARSGAKVPTNASPNVQILDGKSGNNVRFKPDQTDFKGLDLESIAEDLEVCSRILDEADDDLVVESSDTSYRSIPGSCIQSKENNLPEKLEHVMPIVTVVEGPDNTTLSFSEDDFKDILEHEVKEPVQNKINIISDVVVAHGEAPEEKLQEAIENEQYFDRQIEKEAESVRSVSTPGDVNRRCNPEEATTRNDKLYKSFDSTFDATRLVSGIRTLESGTSVYSFRSLSAENYESVNSSEFLSVLEGNEDETNPAAERSNYPSSGYEIRVVDNPKSITTSSSKENGEEKSSGGDQQEKTVMTSVSYASKARKLEEVSTDSTREDQNGAICPSLDTSLSSASKKRNLDQLTSDSTASNEKSDNKTKEGEKVTSSSKEGDGDENKTDKPQECEPRSRERGRKSKKPVIRPRKFIPPRKLTAKEIKEEFQAQDRKFLESNPSSPTYSAYVKQLINRPSVKQLQQMTHLALVRKTEEGVEVIPAEPCRKKANTTAWKKNRSTDGFDVTIFSDRNAATFENYLNSNEKDYDTFAFNFNRNRAAEKVFNFEPGPLTFGDYTGQSVSQRFVRTVSEMSCERQSGKTTELENRNVTLCVSGARIDKKLTPDGFYKQNKEEIAMIVGKYLCNEEKDVPKGIIGRTMFESSDIDENSLEI